MEKIGLLLGVLGGLGLGVLLGSEFNGVYTTIVGAIIIIVFLFSLLFASHIPRKK